MERCSRLFVPDAAVAREEEPAACEMPVATVAWAGQETQVARAGAARGAPASAGPQKERASSRSTKRSVCPDLV